MSGLVDALRHTSSCLEQLRLPWALVGGLAVSVRTEPRFTRDIDVAVVVQDDTAAEAAVRGLLARGFRASAVVEQQAAGRLATVRLLPPQPPQLELLVDVLFASSGIEAEICAAADHLEVFSGVRVPVASCAHLLVLKLLARDDRDRPQDAADIRHLLAVLDAGAIATTRAACQLVETRGFNRDRDLGQALDAALHEFRSR